MKRIGIFTLMLITIIGVMSAASKKEGKIQFKETVYDFGNIKEDGGKVTCEFKFENQGNAPLKIESAQAQCGCTKPVFPEGEIAPGESGTIRVTYNPLGRPGGFTKVVTVRCSGSPGKVNLKIRGTVLPK